MLSHLDGERAFCKVSCDCDDAWGLAKTGEVQVPLFRLGALSARGSLTLQSPGFTVRGAVGLATLHPNACAQGSEKSGRASGQSSVSDQGALTTLHPQLRWGGGELVARLIDTHLPIAPRPLPSIPLRGSLDGWVAALLPFNRGRRFAGDVVDDAGDVGHFVDDAA